MPGGGNEYHFNFDTLGNILGVKRAHLVINNNSSNNQLLPTSRSGVHIGSFVLQAGVAENVVVDALSIQEVSGYDILDYSAGYSNLRIKVGGSDYAVYATPNGGPFNVSKPFTVGAGRTVGINVYVDTSPLVDTDQLKLQINSVHAYGQHSGLTPSQTGDGSQSFITTFKQSRLTIAKSTAMEDSVITAGVGNQTVAYYSFKNDAAESITVHGFTLEETADSDEISYHNGYTYLKALPGGSVSHPLAKGNKFGSFSIGAGHTQFLTVYISPNSTTAGDEFQLVLKDIIINGGIEVEGSSIVGQQIRVVAPN